MDAVQQLERQVQQLSLPDLAKFRAWFNEYEWRAWDQQIVSDSASGKLQALADKARAHYIAGQTTPL